MCLFYPSPHAGVYREALDDDDDDDDDSQRLSVARKGRKEDCGEGKGEGEGGRSVGRAIERGGGGETEDCVAGEMIIGAVVEAS